MLNMLIMRKQININDMKNYTKESLIIAYKVVEELMNSDVVRSSYKNSFKTVLNIISDEYIKMDINKNDEHNI